MKTRENYKIKAIPKKARHQNAWDMFATWVGANANNGTWYIGGVIAACGFLTASTTMFISGILSYILMGFAGFIGFKTGLPAMTITRASFGLRGSFFTSLVNILQFIGWAAVNTFIASISVSYIMTNVFNWPAYGKPGGFKGVVLGILIMSILHILSTSLGEHSVHLFERIGIVLVFVVVVWETIVVFQHISLSRIIAWKPSVSIKMTSGQSLDILVPFNFAWVTAISDFTRFSKKKSDATWIPFLGANLGLFWFTLVGIISTIATAITLHSFDANNSDPSTIASKLGLGILAMLVIVITSTTANAVNLMSAGSALNNIVKKFSLTSCSILVTLAAIVVTFIPVFFSNLLNLFTDFLNGIGMFLGPEIAIFLVDFYILHKQKYHYKDFFLKEGLYWYQHGFNKAAIISWLIGITSYLILKQISFIANSIGVSFISMLLAGIFYWILSQRYLYKIKN